MSNRSGPKERRSLLSLLTRRRKTRKTPFLNSRSLPKRRPKSSSVLIRYRIFQLYDTCNMLLCYLALYDMMGLGWRFGRVDLCAIWPYDGDTYHVASFSHVMTLIPQYDYISRLIVRLHLCLYIVHPCQLLMASVQHALFFDNKICSVGRWCEC